MWWERLTHFDIVTPSHFILPRSTNISVTRKKNVPTVPNCLINRIGSEGILNCMPWCNALDNAWGGWVWSMFHHEERSFGLINVSPRGAKLWSNPTTECVIYSVSPRHTIQYFHSTTTRLTYLNTPVYWTDVIDCCAIVNITPILQGCLQRPSLPEFPFTFGRPWYVAVIQRLICFKWVNFWFLVSIFPKF